MSTKAIREALEMLRAQSIANPTLRPYVDAALAELSAIEKAARVVQSGRIYLYATDEQVEAAETLTRIAKESGK